MTHDRTPLGRKLLKMRKDLLEWIKVHRDKVPEAEIARAEVLACELYASACNGTTISGPDKEANTRG